MKVTTTTTTTTTTAAAAAATATVTAITNTHTEIFSVISIFKGWSLYNRNQDRKTTALSMKT